MTPGKWILTAGLLIALVGLVLLGFEKLGVQWGRLPLDFKLRGENWVVSIPLATSLIISVLLTVLLNLLWRK